MTRGAARRRLWRLTRVFTSPLVAVHEAFHPSVAQVFPGVQGPARRAWLMSVSLAAVAIAVAAWLNPLILVVAAAVTVALMFIRWVWRVIRERRAVLPPGGPARGWSLITDPDHYRDRWRRLGPVFNTGFAGRPLVCIGGLERGALLLADETSIGRGEMGYDRLVPGGIARRMEGRQARYYRPLLNGAFRPAMIRASEDVLVGHIEAAVADLAGGGHGAGGVDPLPGIERMLAAAWLELFFGLEPDSPTTDAVTLDLGVLVRYRHLAGADSEAAIARIETAIKDHAHDFDGRWTRPNAMSIILEKEPTAIEDPTLMRNLIMLAETTRHDVGGLLMWLTKHIVDHPEWQERLRRGALDTDDEGDVDASATAVVSETLRMEQSEYLSRVAVTDTVVEAHIIPAGCPVRVLVAESHRDPDVFENPDEYRPDRFIGRRYGRTEYSPFGVNDRTCVGEQLSRFVGKQWVLALCARHRVIATADGRRAYSAQRHWAPSPKFRIRLEELDGT